MPQTIDRRPRSSIRANRPAWKLALFSLTPVALLILVAEIGLRLCGVYFNPHDLSAPLFVPSGPGQLRTNPVFARNAVYVPHNLCHDQTFPPDNPREILRVALVGGSTIWLLFDAQVLRERLAEKIKRPAAAINMGVLGCGSERDLWSTREALGLDVDVLVLYTGHNEFMSFSNPATYLEPPSGTRWLPRHSRCYQVAWALLQGEIGPEHQLVSTQTFSRVRRYSPAEKELVYRNFRNNLLQMIRIWGDRPLVLATLPSNLRDPPRIPCTDKVEAAASQLSVDQLQNRFEAGKAGAWTMNAFGLRLLEKGGHADQARALLVRAVDLSPCPDRAGGVINGIIRGVASEMHIPLADVEEAIVAQSPDRAPGLDEFMDNCHLRKEGMRVQQNVLADAIAEALNRRTHTSQ